MRSSPPVALPGDVVLPDVPPGNDGQDDDDHRAIDDQLGQGRVDGTGYDRRQGDDVQPDHIPEALEDQDRQQSYGIPQAEERQQGVPPRV
jgi:hypothetical protein